MDPSQSQDGKPRNRKPVPPPPSPTPSLQEDDKVKGITGRIMHFSPSWFSVTMGTGIPCTLLLSLPWPSVVPHLRIPATMFLLLDLALFFTFTTVISVRYIRWPQIWALTWHHPTHSLFIGTFPMSLFTLISGTISVTQAYGMGEGWIWAMSYCWWASVLVSILVAFMVPFLSYTSHKNVPESLTSALILPIVPTITGSAIGAVLAAHMTKISPKYAMNIWLTSYVLLGPGLLLAMMILTLYLQRLIHHHIPPNETIVSSFLPLGPTGLGGFALLKMGAVAVELFPIIYPENRVKGEVAGWALWGVGLGGAILLWALGVWFFLVALASFFLRWREGELTFNMGYWGFTFPLASLTLSTLLIGSELDSMGFNVVGTVFTITMILLWAGVFVPTIRGACSGSKVIFAAPCLSNLPPEVWPQVSTETKADSGRDGDGNLDGEGVELQTL
ncbi:voltage-dependent anion channel-domain-containing protein [Mrakia frigida]|uniref:voltage-dependent anion channel-domain-containing protein n=1 Tax=Mrakia frigida TaxID=29902 RepID=UPI003FCBFF9E